jgi:CheY-like chemotaxis protein
MKILIVDDNRVNLYLLETLLTKNGYEVESTLNGAEAVKKLRSELFDMIISDILMPVMDGFQLCREVKGDDELRNIPFVFYTSTYTHEKDEDFALKLGASKFLRKPTEPDKFITIIQDIMKDVERGKVEQGEPTLEDKQEVLKLYSERLVNKLEKKMLDLEREVARREEAEEKLRRANDSLLSFNQELGKKVRERTRELRAKDHQLIEAEKFAAVGRIVNRVADELRNPLTVIGGFARRIYARTPDADPNKRYLEIIVREVIDLEKKVSEILKMESGN